jgi:hypothetical protein
MKYRLSPSLLALAIGLAAGNALAATAAPAADLSLQQKVDQLSRQLEQMQTQLQAVEAAQTPVSPKLAAFEKVSLWGYGEINYTRPTRIGTDTRADLARAVLGVGYEFDEATRFNSEFEIEHAVASADDGGEVEVEQFYVDHDLNKSVAVQAGLFLIPSGLLNESHEPTHYYGVQRNFIEKLIIPSTWREGGVALHGDTEAGLRWNVGLTTGQDLSKWEFNPETPAYASALELQGGDAAPLGATHQELQLAHAQHLAQYLSLNYLGLPGLDVGGSVFTGLASNPASSGSQRITLWEVHSRWTPGKLDLSALYAHGAISNTGAVNLLNAGASNPMPASFYGYFGQAAYTVWEKGPQRVSPFVRVEHYNLGDRFEGLAPGFGAVPAGPVVLENGSTGTWPRQADTIYTMGINYYLNPNVVFKADYQSFRVNKDFTRVDLGIGVAF